MPTWPVTEAPQPDESISSWLIRSALGLGCDPISLTGWLWPQWRAWTYDLDRGLTKDKQLVLAGSTGISRSSFEAASLSGVAANFSARALPKHGIWPWIQALGARNRRYRGGLQVCPSCFRGDPIPYYRKHWRFSWVTACPQHKAQLVDRCPGCNSPLEPQRLEAIHAKVLSICASCGFDFRFSPQASTPVDAIEFQQLSQSVLIEGGGSINAQVVSCTEWFDVCRFLLVILRRSMLLPDSILAQSLERACGRMVELSPDKLAFQLELLDVEARAELMAGLFRLVTNLQPLSEELWNAKASASCFADKNDRVPAPLTFIVDALAQPKTRRASKSRSSASTPRSKVSVMRSWARLKRKYRVSIK